MRQVPAFRFQLHLLGKFDSLTWKPRGLAVLGKRRRRFESHLLFFALCQQFHAIKLVLHVKNVLVLLPLEVLTCTRIVCLFILLYMFLFNLLYSGTWEFTDYHPPVYSSLLP